MFSLVLQHTDFFLLVKQIVFLVVHRQQFCKIVPVLFGIQPARLNIRGRVYPAILPVDSNKVPGKVWKGITDGELDVLDTFEDEEYVREAVGISLTDSSDTMIAYAYIWGNVDDPDLYSEWDFDFTRCTKERQSEAKMTEVSPSSRARITA
ncbi:hypothetical protein CFC21_038677 [Triticum aestivum]|uniref:Putative gamma-glutamylcyclotransferase n=2 Tax=Triticum aestivum TaxID=4565 RepID=A0A9R1FDA7_WHEAT|nr:hypothetical protein CFC21_038677 [Triticum aestivum]